MEDFLAQQGYKMLQGWGNQTSDIMFFPSYFTLCSSAKRSDITLEYIYMNAFVFHKHKKTFENSTKK